MSTSDASTDHPLAYATPAAFRTALKARFAAIARADPRYTLTELQRQFAYDRVLARCFTNPDRDRWVLKGAGALLARLDANARHSKDIDLYYAEHATAADDAVHALQAALDRDLGDYFTFEITGIGVLQEAAKGRRIHLTAMLGPRPYASFHVDVVVDTAMTGDPDPVNPLTPLRLEGLARPAYRAFPLPDHVADKLLAICQTHVHAGQTRASSRVKDLVDIGLIASTHRLDGQPLRTAVVAGAAHRGLSLPAEFTIPAPRTWRARYNTSARDAPAAPTFDDTMAIARRLLNPVLTGPINSSWDPTTRDWTPPPEDRTS